MPTPKRKVSRARRDKRSANKGLKPKAIASCQTCQARIATHKICSECGYYKGVKVLRTKTDRKYHRAQSREAVAAKAEARQSSGSGDTSAAS
ncbi:50S ribosomal protein L32 [Candidatus Dependentiae bacterium]|nr:50S ribosomal protein L32 [Candidatus Dependentiae bacterium]